LSNWSVQRVEQLAPDAAAIKAAQGIAKPTKWGNLGRDEHTVWGECHGSGSNPYQVRVDLQDAACKCSCPSRKLPCKHSLGLLLLLAGGAEIPLAPAPAFVAEWTASRAKRAEAKVVRAVASEKPPDSEAQSKRAEKREARIETGLAQLDAWLADIVAQGLAAARAQPASFWEQMAARLIDAQAPGLARRVRELGELAVSGADWQSRLLAGLARMQLLIDAYRRIERLPGALAAEVRTLVGWTQDQSALLERAGVRDRWQVLGRRQGQQDQVRVQYTWLLGLESRQPALILEFAVGNQPLPVAYVIGQVVEAELVYFDGAPPLRALLKQRLSGQPSARELPGALDVAGLQSAFAQALTLNPWIERWPMTLGPVRVMLEREDTFFVDAAGRRIAARQNFRHGWHLLSLAAGQTLSVFGLWDGHSLDPLTVAHASYLYSLSHIGESPVLSKVA
jgi:SWIM zinc finger